jgi:hypothetical protein
LGHPTTALGGEQNVRNPSDVGPVLQDRALSAETDS